MCCTCKHCKRIEVICTCVRRVSLSWFFIVISVRCIYRCHIIKYWFHNIFSVMWCSLLFFRTEHYFNIWNFQYWITWWISDDYPHFICSLLSPSIPLLLSPSLFSSRLLYFSPFLSQSLWNVIEKTDWNEMVSFHSFLLVLKMPFSLIDFSNIFLINNQYIKSQTSQSFISEKSEVKISNMKMNMSNKQMYALTSKRWTSYWRKYFMCTQTHYAAPQATCPHSNFNNIGLFV